MEIGPSGAPKCSRCHGEIAEGEDVLNEYGEWNHVQCLLAHAHAAAGMPTERPAILCVRCLVGIVSLDELDMTASGPTHIHCRPIPTTAPS